MVYCYTFLGLAGAENFSILQTKQSLITALFPSGRTNVFLMQAKKMKFMINVLASCYEIDSSIRREEKTIIKCWQVMMAQRDDTSLQGCSLVFLSEQIVTSLAIYETMLGKVNGLLSICVLRCILQLLQICTCLTSILYKDSINSVVFLFCDLVMAIIPLFKLIALYSPLQAKAIIIHYFARF